jgi:SAM-dependent methyltransferase
VRGLPEAIGEGHYARKQIFSRDRLVAWSHRRRFDTALSLAKPFAGKRLLDYGCGDGTFLALSMLTTWAPAAGVGTDVPPYAVSECDTRYRNEPRLTFFRVAELDAAGHAGQYDAVFCMEVLEHVVDWDPELERMSRVLSPGGALVISVPVETGLPLLVKQTVRRIAGWRGIGHYPGTSGYSWPELRASLGAGATQHITRPVFDLGSGPAHDHKGFNWMVLRSRLEQQFDIDRVLASPFQWAGPHLATQAWFVCRKR